MRQSISNAAYNNSRPNLPPKKPTPKPPAAHYVAPRPPKAQDSGRNNDASEGGNRGRHPAGGGAKGVTGAVNAEIRAGVQSLRQDRRIARRQAKRDRRQTMSTYRRSLGDLDYIYDETGDYINSMGQQINQGFQDQSARQAAAQQQFVSSLQANSDTTGQGLSTELSRLGLQGVDNSQYAADAQNALNVAGQMGVNNQANLGMAQTSANNISSLLGGMVQGSHLSNVGQANNAKNDLLFQIFQNKHDAYDKVAEAISDLKGTRGDLTKQMMEQLGSSPWGKHVSGKGKKRYSRRSSSYTPYSSGGSSSGSKGTKPGNPNDPNSLAALLQGALNG